MRSRQWIAALLLLLVCTAVGVPAKAEDIEIYGNPSALPPNVLLIFDNSSSMVDPENNIIDRRNNKVHTSFDYFKEQLELFIRNSKGINLGLMVFNNNAEGGKIVYRIQDSLAEGYDEAAVKEALINALNSEKIRPLWVEGRMTYTPLAETLAEAGLYFAGRNSHFNTGESDTMPYTSPIVSKCQENNVVIITDGVPTRDRNEILFKPGAYMGRTIGDQDNDGKEPGGKNEERYDNEGSDYLDDVAKFLFNNDLRPDMGASGEQYEKQFIITHVFAYKLDVPILEDAATGEDKYHSIKDPEDLQKALNSMLASIATPDSVFVAPVVPISRTNRTYSGDSLYMGFFKAHKSGRWNGNLKKYTIDADGTIQGVDSQTGEILDTAKSVWSREADGSNALAGGVGALLKAANEANFSRNIYTNLVADLSLSSKENHFKVENTSFLTNEKLGEEATVGGTAARARIIDDVRGPGRTWDKGEDDAVKGWIMGDILHSEPAVAHIDDDDYIFVGANDGMLHCFRDSDGVEEWAFIPDDLLPKLKYLSDGNPDHDYFVDGSPKIYSSGSDRILFFGERRGGNHYHALTVTNPASPVYKFKTGPDRLGEGAEQLGQSWGVPLIGTIKTSETESAKVLVLPGGYDTNQDGTPPASDADSKGRAVFAVDAATGEPKNNLAFTCSENVKMTHSIVDVSGADTDGDGNLDRLYAGDMFGQVFAFRDENEDGKWEMRRLFSASGTGESERRKIFGAPDFVTITSPVKINGSIRVGEMAYFGTGDRAHPTGTGVRNRIYAVKNFWDEASIDLSVNTATEDNEAVLCDLSANLIQTGTDAQIDTTVDCLRHPQNRGWYFDLEDVGEQIVGSPVVFDGVVYFTTYTPPEKPVRQRHDDYNARCDVPVSGGTGRFYAVDAGTAAAVLNLNTDSDALDKSDRSRVVSDAMPSEPVVLILKEGPLVAAGTGGGEKGGLGLETFIPPRGPGLHIHYWRDMK